jgi:repressor of nif and glnA expression
MVKKTGANQLHVEQTIKNILAVITDTPGITSEEAYSRLVENGTINIGISAVRRHLRKLCKKKIIRRVGVWEYRHYPGEVKYIPPSERWNNNFRRPE